MYTATLTNKLIEGGKIRWVVTFTDGVDTFNESFYVNKYSDLQPRVAYRLAELNFVDTFTLGATVDATVPVAVPLTLTETERSTWLRDWHILQQADKLIAAGVIVATLPAYITHKTKVQNNFKVGYINYL